MSYVPTPFATPIYPPSLSSAYREAPYISPSWYRFAPTAVGTLGLVPGSPEQSSDSLASLAEVISRASAWMDEYCFWKADGSFSASVTVESAWVLPKPTGQLVLITNFKPIRTVIGVAVGCAPSQVQTLDQNCANDITTGEKTITLPGYWTGSPRPFFGGYPSTNGLVYCVYSYVAGWPHTTLAASVTAGATSITVNPSTPGGSALYGAQAGTPLTIKDAANAETVVLASTPTSLTLSLVNPVQYNHTIPVAPSPDSIIVTALPWGLEQACVHITSVLLKTRGTRSTVLPQIGGASMPNKQALARAGALADFDVAMKLLHPFQVAYLH